MTIRDSLLTPGQEAYVLMRAYRATERRIARMEQEIEPSSVADRDALDGLRLWNFKRLLRAYELRWGHPPGIVTRTLRRRDDGSWERAGYSLG